MTMVLMMLLLTSNDGGNRVPFPGHRPCSHGSVVSTPLERRSWAELPHGRDEQCCDGRLKEAFEHRGPDTGVYRGRLVHSYASSSQR